MFFLYQNGEGYRVNSYDYVQLSEQFGQLFLQQFRNENRRSTCKFRKGKTICNSKCLEHGGMSYNYCDKHYTDERKQMIRSFFEEHHMYIPENTTILEELVIPESWTHFTNVLVRDSQSVLNTLSLIIQIESPTTFDLKVLSNYLRSCHDSIIEESKSNQSIDDENDIELEVESELRTAFHNVIEFIVLFQMGTKLHNASVKIWHNNYIHICGCKDIFSSLKIASTVLRTLRRSGNIHSEARVSSINPVFANASFDFFPQTIVVNNITRPLFVQRMRNYLQEASPESNISVISENSDQYAQFCFQLEQKRTTVKVYPRGNVIITVNNFDGYLLQLALQVLQRTADDQDVYLRDISETKIRIQTNVNTPTNTFTFSPLRNNTSVTPRMGFSKGQKRAFGEL